MECRAAVWVEWPRASEPVQAEIKTLQGRFLGDTAAINIKRRIGEHNQVSLMSCKSIVLSDIV
jgi:hypothetical protein